MTVDVQAESMRLGCSRGHPRRIECPVEFDRNEAIRLRFADDRQGLVLGGSDDPTWAVLGPFPSIRTDGYTWGISSSPFARRAARARVKPLLLPGSRTEVMPNDSSMGPLESPATCWCESQSPGTNVLPLPSITCALAGTAVSVAGPAQ